MNPVESSGTARFHELEAEYEIVGELGRGGTAVVYRARERELGRDVAIKVVRSNHVDDAEAVARLAREAKLVAALRHPNIVPLLGIRHLSDGLALIMQHVPGRTLKRAIREDGPLTIALAEHVLREIGSALDYAHKKQGIVHRDIKPENIYLDEEVGRALLSDFGIARSTEGESTLTLVGTALGTPAYMSPEQIDGTALDGRSDLYSLGLVAYEMLTGQQPWAGHNLYTIIYKQKHEELPPLASFRNDIPPYLQRAVDSLLRKDVAARCSDAAQFIAQLPAAANTPLDFAPAVRVIAPAEPEISDDSPTLRYQRPTVVVAEPPVEPAVAALPEVVVDPVAVPLPIAATTELKPVAEVVSEPAAPPVLELPTVRPNWRRPTRGRGGLAAGGVYAHPEVTALQTIDEETAEEQGDRRDRRSRLVAGLTLFLVLGGSATVVAMMNGRDKPVADAGSTERTTANRPSPASLLKASGQTPILTAGNAGTAASPAGSVRGSRPDSMRKAVTDAKPLPVPLPNVTMPEITPTEDGRITAAEFASAGVMPTETEENISSAPAFTPHTVSPMLRNRDVVQRALAENYPRVLRERNIGGSVRLWVLVDSLGRVLRSQVSESSGNAILDQAATKVADVMQFTPAMNRDRKVSVWILLPINFRTQ